MVKAEALYREVRRLLVQAGRPAFDAACLFEKHTGIPRGRLPIERDTPVPDEIASRLRRDAAARAAGEPLQYLLGEWEFRGLSFFVGPGVLIPRPETELLVEKAASFLQKKESPARLLELCAGSGCAAISAARETVCQADCLDISPEALGYLERNIARHGLKDRVRAVKGDIKKTPERRLFGAYDVLLCNPPYIRTSDLPDLQKEVRQEPVLALDGGADGLAFYRALRAWLPVLKPGGLLACEVGFDEAEAVSGLLTGAGLKKAEITKDDAGLDRVVSGLFGG